MNPYRRTCNTAVRLSLVKYIIYRISNSCLLIYVTPLNKRISHSVSVLYIHQLFLLLCRQSPRLQMMRTSMSM